MIKYIQGDLLKTGAKIIAHGCNCQGAFGAGVAGQIAKKYPLARELYLKKFHEKGWNLGDVQFVKIGDKIIANCGTQFNFGNSFVSNVVYCDYNAIEECMKKLKAFSIKENYNVAIPKIGAGLAGGDWSIIEKIINDIFQEKEILVYYLK